MCLRVKYETQSLQHRPVLCSQVVVCVWDLIEAKAEMNDLWRVQTELGKIRYFISTQLQHLSHTHLYTVISPTVRACNKKSELMLMRRATASV